MLEGFMSDKSWLLNPSAITAAKKCIVVIEQEFGVRLRLAQPHFLEMVEEYSNRSHSNAINRAKNELLAYAGQNRHEILLH